MKRSGCVLIVLAMAVGAPAASPGHGPQADRRDVAVAEASAATDITPARLAAALVAETNRVRRVHGCRPLRPHRELNAAAEDQAAYMALMHRAGHGNALHGQADVLERVLRHGIRPAEVAENVAAQPVKSASAASSCAAIAAGLVEAWMNSPGHRANLLNRQFTHLGCAARVVPVHGRTEYVFGAQVFSTAPRDDLLQI